MYKEETCGPISEKQAIKENMIRTVIHHCKYCEGVDCDVSVYLLRRCLELAGIELTEEERILFL